MGAQHKSILTLSTFALTILLLGYSYFAGRQAKARGVAPWYSILAGKHAKIIVDNWEQHGKAPALLHAGDHVEARLGGIKSYELRPGQEMYRPPVPPQYHTELVVLGSRGESVAYRLFRWTDLSEAEQQRLREEATTLFAEIMSRLAPIRMDQVTARHRAGYEAICGLHGRDRVDNDYANDAGWYLIILLEDLRRQSQKS